MRRTTKAARDSEAMTNKSRFETERSYEKLLERFSEWAENQLDIRAAVVIGSRARVDHAADEWADLDTIIITTDPERYVSTSDWISNFGKPLLTFIELPRPEMKKNAEFSMRECLMLIFP